MGAEKSILSKFNVLKPTDISASTAVLNPNAPGSTGIKLSWLWQTSASHLLNNADDDAEKYADDPASLLECAFLFLFHFYILNLITCSSTNSLVTCSSPEDEMARRSNINII